MCNSRLEMLARQLAELPAGCEIAILPHVRADGDALGSGLALCSILEKTGLSARFFVDETVAEHYAFLPGRERAELYCEGSSLGRCERLFLIDAHDVKRLGRREAALEGRRPDFCLDHHLMERELLPGEWVEDFRSSSGEMVALLAFALERITGKKLLDQATAVCLIAAIYADTGGLRYSNSGAETFAVLARLMQEKPEIDKISEALFSSLSLGKLRARGRAFEKSEWLAGGRLAFCTFSLEDLAESGASDSDLEGICSELREVRGTELAVFIRLMQGGAYPRVNLRSSGKVNAAELAARFGGGGHFRAAGCSLEGEATPEEKIRIFREAALQAVEGAELP